MVDINASSFKRNPTWRYCVKLLNTQHEGCMVSRKFRISSGSAMESPMSLQDQNSAKCQYIGMEKCLRTIPANAVSFSLSGSGVPC